MCALPQCAISYWYLSFSFLLPLASAYLQAVGGDGPKMIDLLQMREKYLLQDRIEMLGPVRHNDVRSVSQLSIC